MNFTSFQNKQNRFSAGTFQYNVDEHDGTPTTYIRNYYSCKGG